jgi:hypothetical protein
MLAGCFVEESIVDSGNILIPWRMSNGRLIEPGRIIADKGGFDWK